MKNEYRNSIRSKELIREAFIKLLNKKKDLSQITVSEIVNLANINRGTFYNHYNNVMEVIEEMENELFEELATNTKKLTSPKNVGEIITNLIVYFKNHEKDYKTIAKCLPKPVFDNLKIKFITQITSFQPKIDEIKLLFIVNGLAGIYLDYLDDRVKISIDEIGAQAIKMINDLIEND